SLQIVATISDFVGAPPFFAITRLLVKKLQRKKYPRRAVRRATYHTHSHAQAFSLHMNAANALFSRLARTCAEPRSTAPREIFARTLYESSPFARCNARRFDVEVCG
ncbi:MAG TPA: hypothetical protein VEW08_15050, partial [Steroidobacteraceae bacterium]|nr:hypothetical protein [Steroidobacteraceae bacterium]